MKKEELKFLIQQGEGYNVEFKEKYSPSIDKEICAMANATGGKILIGIDDKGKIVSAKLTNVLKSQIQDLARKFDPALSVDISELGGVIIIDVPEGSKKPYSAGGKFYLRQGSNSQQLSRDEIKDFFVREGLIMFDDQLTEGFDIKKDVNVKVFDNFLKMCNISKLLPMEALLENLSLTKNGKMKNAGTLLFVENIIKFFNQATINCVFFRGKDKYTILDKKEFTSNIYDNYEGAFNFIQSKLNTEYIIKGGPRREVLELPEEALREAILNAIVHRDYFVRGANIQIYIFSDRVEITNPGGLVKGMTIKDLGKKSLSRNNLLFGLMQRMDLVEKSGSGFLRIRGALRKYGLSELTIENSKNWFTVIFKRPDLQKRTMRERIEGKTTQKTTPKTTQKIITILIDNPHISREDLAKK